MGAIDATENSSTTAVIRRGQMACIPIDFCRVRIEFHQFWQKTELENSQVVIGSSAERI